MFLSREGRISKIHMNYRGIWDIQKLSFFTYSRDALNKIIELNNIDNSDEIIMPDYICSTVLEIILPVTQKIKFYKINHKLNYNEEEIQNLISNKTKLIIFVDYFGIESSVSERLEQQIKKHKIILVKDAAHSFLTILNNDFVKKYNYDYVISSIYKNLPLQVGSIAAGNFYDTKNFINASILIKRFFVLFVKNLIYFLRLQKFITNNIFEIQTSDSTYKNSSYGINAYQIYSFFFRRINFKRIIKERRQLGSKFDSYIRNSSHFTPMIDKKLVDKSILQAYPLIFKCKNERDDLLKIMIKNGIDAYTWPTFHSVNYNEDLWNKVLLLPLEKKVLKVIANV